MSDLTSGLKGASYVRQKCTMYVSICVYAMFVQYMHVHVLYVIFEGETMLFQQPRGLSPINHTYHVQV